MLAYFETVRNGLVPVRITRMVIRKSGYLDITCVVTDTISGYKQGECINSSGLHVIPLHAVRRRKYNTTILFYAWSDEAAKAGFVIEREVA